MTDENHKMQNTEEPERPFSLTLLIWKMRKLKSYFGLCAESDHQLEAKGTGFNGIRITMFSNAVVLSRQTQGGASWQHCLDGCPVPGRDALWGR